MDRFVVRTPREIPGSSPPGARAGRGPLRQATLGSLRRVVSLADVERLLDAIRAAGVDGGDVLKKRKRVENKETNDEVEGTETEGVVGMGDQAGTEDNAGMDVTDIKEKCERNKAMEGNEKKQEMKSLKDEEAERRLMVALSALRHKVPSRELLLSTGLGRAIRRLRRRCCGDPGVAVLAAEMYERWRGFYEARDSLGPLQPVRVSKGPRRQATTASALTSSYSGSGRGIVSQLRDTARGMLTRALAEKSNEVKACETVQSGSMTSQEDRKPRSTKRERKDRSGATITQGKVESRPVNPQGDVDPSSSEAPSGNETCSLDAISELSPVAVQLEQEVFSQLGGSNPSFSSSSYRRTVRALTLVLTHRPQLREALASGAMTPREAVSSHRKP